VEQVGDAGDLTTPARPHLEVDAAGLRAVLDLARTGFALVTTGGRVIEANPSFCRNLGRLPDELRGLDLLDVVHPSDRAELADALRSLHHAAAPPAATVQLELRALGERHATDPAAETCLRTSLTRVDAGADGPMTVVELEDLREHRAAQRQLSEHADEVTARLNATLETMSDGLYVLDRDWRFVYVNPRAEQMLQRRRDQLLGRSLWDTVPGMTDQVRATYRKVMRDRQPVSFDEVHHPPYDRWFELTLYPSPQGLTVHFRDITRRVEAREAIRAREAQLARQAALLDEARDAILVHDLDDLTISYFSRGAERLYGTPAADAVGRRADELFGVDDPELVDDALGTLRQEGAWNGEVRQRATDGRELVVASRTTLLPEEGDGRRSVLVINTDVTDRRRVEQQLVRAQRMESMGGLASGIAHDLNNLLSPMLLAVDLLAADEPDPARAELLQTIRSSASRGSEMVARILSFARGADGERVPVAVGELIEEVVRLLCDSVSRDVEVVAELDDELPPLLGDPTQLHQVLLNLGVNGRDAMPDGGRLTLRARHVEVAASADAAVAGLAAGPHVLLEVSDTGVGMDAATQARVFEPFFTTKPPGAGTGLGLSTTRTIVESHGGTLSVDSAPGRGTTIRIHLPAG
jgi:two-component system cell cycle sensor histidine kinase/response regulator CckA